MNDFPLETQLASLVGLPVAVCSQVVSYLTALGRLLLNFHNKRSSIVLLYARPRCTGTLLSSGGQNWVMHNKSDLEKTGWICPKCRPVPADHERFKVRVHAGEGDGSFEDRTLAAYQDHIGNHQLYMSLAADLLTLRVHIQVEEENLRTLLAKHLDDVSVKLLEMNQWEV